VPSRFRALESIAPSDHGREVSVAGWVEDVRNLGGIAFFILRQRGGTLQATFKKKADEALFQRATDVIRESVIAVRGTVQPNPQVRNGWEVLASSLDVLSSAAAPLPLPVADKVGAEMDTRLDNRVLDLRKPERRAIFRVRSIALAAIREHLVGHSFLEVQTPKLAGAGAEGGATLFETTYFGRRAFLSQSPQLYKQMLMATGLDRVYEIAPAFRAEPSDTVRHVTEFTSFDAEVAWIESQEDFLPFLEGAVRHAIERVRAEAKAELALLGADPKVPSVPLKRLSYAEALEVLGGAGKRVRDGDDIDPRSRGERTADRLGGLDREGEGDLAHLERRAETEGKLAGVRFEDPDVDVLAGEDRDRGVAADDGIERAGGVRRGIGRADADELDHLGGDRRQDRDVDLGPDDAVAGLGEVDEGAGAQGRDEEEGDVDATARSHSSLLQ